MFSDMQCAADAIPKMKELQAWIKPMHIQPHSTENSDNPTIPGEPAQRYRLLHPCVIR